MNTHLHSILRTDKQKLERRREDETFSLKEAKANGGLNKRYDLEEKSTKPVEQQDQGSRETVAPETLQINPNGLCIPTMEEVMEDLHHVTRQYLSCPDPVEAEARRQRVLLGDASGQMEETAVAIIAAETRRQALLSQSMGDESNPNTPSPPDPKYS